MKLAANHLQQMAALVLVAVAAVAEEVAVAVQEAVEHSEETAAAVVVVGRDTAEVAGIAVAQPHTVVVVGGLTAGDWCKHFVGRVAALMPYLQKRQNIMLYRQSLHEPQTS